MLMNSEPLSGKCRFRHFPDYAEEKQIPKLMSIFPGGREMASETSA
jgi:hypothetical protein